MHLQAASSRLRYFLRTLSEALRCALQLAWQASGNGLHDMAASTQDAWKKLSICERVYKWPTEDLRVQQWNWRAAAPIRPTATFSSHCRGCRPTWCGTSKCSSQFFHHHVFVQRCYSSWSTGIERGSKMFKEKLHVLKMNTHVMPEVAYAEVPQDKPCLG